MANVTLDMETFKALASETRLQVLRALDERRKTLSELSRELAFNKATVHEHLQLLTATGLVKKRDDEGRKWIYYELTWRGERLLHPQETTTFAVLLGIAIVAASVGVVFFGGALDIWMDQAPEPALDGDAGDQPGIAAAPSEKQDNGTADQADGQPEASELRAAPAPEPAKDADDDFWDDGGLIGALSAATALLAVVLAVAIRRRMGPH